MNYKEVITGTPWADVETQLLKDYPGSDLPGHARAYEILQGLEAQANPMRIVVEVLEPEDPEDLAEVDVFGLNGTLRRDHEAFASDAANGTLESLNEEMPCALDLMPWEEWLGMEVDPRSLERFARAELVAHCLWELTFHGFEPSKIRAFAESLRARVEAIEAMSPDERRLNAISLEYIAEILSYEMDDEDGDGDLEEVAGNET
jgi:hypothetical protein